MREEGSIEGSRFFEVRRFYAQTVTILNAQQRKFFNAIYVKGRKRYIPALLFPTNPAQKFIIPYQSSTIKINE